jgi:cobalt-zinc-cadmium efflux system outer membrane protein
VVLATRMAEAARRRARAGDVGALEVRLAELEAARAAHARGTADVDGARAAARLATAIGAPADETLAIGASDETPAAPPPEDVMVAHALDARPDLIAARAERARLEGEAALVRRRGMVPNPVVRGFYRQEFGDERIVGGEVAVPLPLWNRAQGTEVATRAAAAGAAADVVRLESEIPRQIRVALARRRAAAEAWDRYRRDALPAAGDARALVERAYEGGYLGLPEVLVQQDRLRDVRAAAIDAWLELRTADADLLEAVGGALP